MTTIRFFCQTFELETMTDQEFDELHGRVIDYGSDLIEEQAFGPASIGMKRGRVALSDLIAENSVMLEILGQEADRRRHIQEGKVLAASYPSYFEIVHEEDTSYANL